MTHTVLYAGDTMVSKIKHGSSLWFTSSISKNEPIMFEKREVHEVIQCIIQREHEF